MRDAGAEGSLVRWSVVALGVVVALMIVYWLIGGSVRG
jgi:hypothetical protein